MKQGKLLGWDQKEQLLWTTSTWYTQYHTRNYTVWGLQSTCITKDHLQDLNNRPLTLIKVQTRLLLSLWKTKSKPGTESNHQAELGLTCGSGWGEVQKTLKGYHVLGSLFLPSPSRVSVSVPLYILNGVQGSQLSLRGSHTSGADMVSIHHLSKPKLCFQLIPLKKERRRKEPFQTLILRHGQVTGFGQCHLRKEGCHFQVNTLSISQCFAEFPLQSKPTRSRTIDRAPCTATRGQVIGGSKKQSLIDFSLWDVGVFFRVAQPNPSQRSFQQDMAKKSRSQTVKKPFSQAKRKLMTSKQRH